MEFKEFLLKYKNLFLTAELMGLFHDIGKMSSSFVKAGTDKNIKSEEKYEKGANEAHTKKSLFEEEFRKKVDSFINKIISDTALENIIQKDDFMEIIINHHNAGKLGSLASKNYIADVVFMPGCDGIDSGFDKGNVSRNGIQSLDSFHAVNFAGKKEYLNWQEFDNKRKQLEHKITEIIDKNLPLEIVYEKVLNTYMNFTQEALAETRIPANDVKLSDHCYSVASLSKTLIVKLLWDFINNSSSKNELIKWYTFKSLANWQILAIRWNFDKYVENLRRLSDLLGRQELLNEFKNKLQNLLQFKYFIANKIYDDNESILFLFPPFNLDFMKNNASFLIEEIINLFPKELRGETVLDIFMYKKPDVNLLKIADFFDESKINQTFKLLHSENFANQIDEKIRQKIAKGGWNYTLCEVCKTNITKKMFDDDKICKDCEEIRKKAPKSISYYETPLLEEIAKDSKIGKLAVVSINLPTEMWINGSLLKTVLIKNIFNAKKDIKSIAKKLNPYYKEFKEFIKQNNIRFLKDYWENRNILPDKLKYKEDKLLEKFGLNKIGLRERTIKDKLKYGFKEENYVVADIIAYMLEEIFIQDLAELDKFKDLAEIIEIFYKKYPSPSRIRRIIEDAEEFARKVISIPKTYKRKYRTILCSPRKVALIIPAEFTKDFLVEVFKLQNEEFKFIFGKFPLFVVIGFFKDKFPLYVSLEAIKNAQKVKFKELILSYKDSVLKNDKYNFCIDLSKHTKDLDEITRIHFLNYISEDEKLINIDKLQDKNKIKFYPSVVDFLIFDTPERRFDTLHYKDNYPFERYDEFFRKYIKNFFVETQDIEKVFNIIQTFDNIESSKVYKYMEILEKNYQNWSIPDDKLLNNYWKKFIEDTYEMFLSSSIKDQNVRNYIIDYAQDLRIFKVFDIWKYLKEDKEEQNDKS